MSVRLRRALAPALVLVLVLVLALAVLAEPALADTSKVGENVGEEVRSWGKALLLGLATLVGLPALAKRDTGQAMVVALIVVVLGGFVFAGGTIREVIRAMWTAFGA